LIHTQHYHNNHTTTPHMSVGLNVWGPPSCEGLLCGCCIGVVNLTFFLNFRFKGGFCCDVKELHFEVCTFLLILCHILERRRRSERIGMESASELVAFPLLTTPIESNYRACTIPYRFPSDNPRKPTPTELAWIDLFLNSISSFKYAFRFFSSLK